MPVKLAASDTLKGCHGALLTVATNAGPTPSMQENVNDNSSWRHATIPTEDFLAEQVNNTSSD